MQSQRTITTEPADRLLEPGHTYGSITSKISDIVLGKTPRGWIFGFAIAFLGLMLYLGSITYLFIRGTGIWGLNIPVGWGVAIINFVWWIGIGHAGTLISAILLLLRQQWRTSINRFAEAMTLFAVTCAGLYPILHLGRPWVFYWMIPYPSSLGMWPQFRSPLEWDVFAITTYATVSLLFWLVGLLPDFATLRDRAKNKFVRLGFGVAALGWRGSARHWHRYELASLLLAGLATPLVVSVHSIVSLDFAVAVVPGWHVTVFPPYFVAGAIFAGFAMVILLMIPVRKFYHLEDFVTMRHFDLMAKVLLATGLIVLYGYLSEVFYAWYSGSEFELALLQNRFVGPYAWSYWALLFCNGLVPQLFWFKRFRQSIPALFLVAMVVSVGMWLERWVIVAVSLTRDFLPSSWGYYTPTVWDWALYIGSFGLFFTLLFLFIRAIPLIAVHEMRLLHHETYEHGHAGEHGGTAQGDGAGGHTRPQQAS